MLDEIFNPKKNLELVGHIEKFNFLKKLIIKEKFPNVLMLTGEKGLGKSTIINHLMFFYFDKKNYDSNKNCLQSKSQFYYQFVDNLFPNILFLSGTNFRNIKVEEIRNLKSNLLKTPIIDDKRFIILDDVETFNNNSLNALLKILEEPKNNYFILINNKSKPILETIKSRCMELNINLNNDDKIKIISSLINYYSQSLIIDKNLIPVTPGLFLRFNYFFKEKNIDIENGFMKNLNSILNFYKKDKNPFYKDLLLFYTDYYFEKNKDTMLADLQLIEKRSFVIKDINDFFFYNLNQTSLIKSIERRLG